VDGPGSAARGKADGLAVGAARTKVVSSFGVRAHGARRNVPVNVCAGQAEIQLREDMNPDPDSADKAIVVGAATPEEAQGAYLLRLLSQVCHRTNLRIDMYQRGVALADARGDVGYACAFRHLTHIANDDRQILEDVIDRLQR
jgi:hypothetical protein